MSTTTPPSATAGGGNYGDTASTTAVSTRKLELILNPDDGSLQTAPLLNVVLGVTDSLYSDLYNMTHGDIRVVTGTTTATSASAAAGGVGEDEEYNDTGAATTTPTDIQQYHQKNEKMSNLSFAQRRHELAWRLASHSKAVQHVAALTAAAATSELGQVTDISTKALQHARTAWVQADEAQDALYFFHAQLFNQRKAPHDIYGALDTLLLRYWTDLPADIRLITDRYETSPEKMWSSKEVADRWNMAVRSKLLLGEVGYMKQLQSQQHHHHTYFQSQSQQHHLHHSEIVPWRISLRGGIVRLTHGKPKTTIVAADGTTKTMYPLEAILTVLTTTTTNSYQTKDGNLTPTSSTSMSHRHNIELPDAEWTLVSVEVHAQAKTGQSNHQLDTTNKQRFNLHRLCTLAMSREEARARNVRNSWYHQQQKEEEEEEEKQKTGISPTFTFTTQQQRPNESVARPLNALFQVAHYFSSSWQLEILSAQAVALRKGIWGNTNRSSSSFGGGGTLSTSSSSRTPAYGSSIVVTPVQFFENRSILGIVSISFWTIDDRYGPPILGDLTSVDDDDEGHHEHTTTADTDTNKNINSTHSKSGISSSDSVSTVARSMTVPPVSNQLTLSIRAEPNVGIRVALSGAESIMDFATDQPHIRSTIKELLDATSNPFALSASEALLAATRLCAERKCYAIAQVLPSVLPSWISLHVEKECITVAAQIQYFMNTTTETTNDTSMTKQKKSVTLFRLACDSRTGSFIPTFSRSTSLLQYLACNDLRAASDTNILHATKMAQHQRTSSSSRGAAATFATGRAVRDAFESLSRSMNVLGQRTGVGGTWKDVDDNSPLLRQRAIQTACKDVKVSLMTCCGMAALYGLSAVTINVTTGVKASSDMAGEKLDPSSSSFQATLKENTLESIGASFLRTPPISVLVDQKLIEHSSWTSDGDRVKKSFIEQNLFGICCSVDENNGLTLYGANISVKLDSPSSLPTRTRLSLINFVAPAEFGLFDSTTTKANPIMATMNGDGSNEPPAKRSKTDPSFSPSVTASVSMTAQSSSTPLDIMEEVEFFATFLSSTLGMNRVTS